MKFKLKYISTVLCLALLTSCVDLDYTEVSTNDKEWTYSGRAGVEGLVSDVYANVRYDLGHFNGAMKASATDESDFANYSSNIHTFYNSSWSPVNPFGETWMISYRGIAEANSFLEEIDRIYESLEEYRYNVTTNLYADLLKKYELYEYEVRFIRAYLYFELVRTYGDVPLVTKVMTNAEANELTRTPYSEVFNFIIDECDAIADKLPVTYQDEPDHQYNRANRITVLSLKARTLLYKASPLFNTTGDVALWEDAARANKMVIDFAPLSNVTLGKYSNFSGESNYNNSGMIWVRGTGNPEGYKNNTVEIYNFPIGVENAEGGNCPTQSLVDAYEFKSGPNAGKTFGEVWSANTINLSDNPYDGLDPRFGMTIVKNGDVWPSYVGVGVETFEGGANASPLYGATKTGYYLRKLSDVNANISTNNPSPKKHSFTLFRLGEFYLNYAEAIFHTTGSANNSGDFGMTANEAINVLRARSDVGMPDFNGDDSEFLARYMNERMVELAFEDHRFWDVRRWKKGAEFFNTIKIVNLEKRSDQSIVMTRGEINRGWDEKYNLFPIPFGEIQKNPKLGQNPGW